MRYARTEIAMPASALRSDQPHALLYHARAATPFCSPEGELYASIPSSIDSRRVLPLRSAEFRDWLTANYFAEYESAPSAGAFRDVLRTLEARARYGDLPSQKIDYRIGFEGDPFTPSEVVVDLANSTGGTVEITPQGWDIATNFRHCFREFPSTLPLPEPAPAAPGSEPLHQFANLFQLSPSNRARVFTWIAAALRPVGPYPVLVLSGPAASGKSVLARALRALIDPCTVPLRRLPASDRELLQSADQNWILAFDHVERIPSKISQALCSISSGDAIEITQPDYRDPVVCQIARPLILCVAEDGTPSRWTPSRALSNRALCVPLPRISALRPEAQIWSTFEAFRPSALAALCGSVSTALRRVRDIDVANVTRRPDCAAWAAAAAPALGLEESEVFEAIGNSGWVRAAGEPLSEAYTDSRWGRTGV